MFLCNSSNRPVVVLQKKEADVKLSVLNGEWKIKEVNGEAIPSGMEKQPFIAFDVKKKTIHGNAGCNLINGGFETSTSNAKSISFPGVASTMMACPDMEVEGILSGQLLNNRLLNNGNFGYRDNPMANTNFVGDFEAEWLINRSGDIRLKAYNETNDRYYTRTNLTTQVIGIIFKKDFNRWKELMFWNKWRLKRLRREMEQKEARLKETFFRGVSQKVVQELEKGGNVILSDEDWDDIVQNADIIFDSFTNRLQQTYPSLNKDDLRFCCMVKMQLSQSSMAQVMHLERDSVKKRLKRIRMEKMGADSGVTLEELLYNF